MAHVFISYAKKDTRDLALRLHEMLNATPGLTAWMDMSLEADTSWAAQIQREIDCCDYVVVLLSPDVNRAVTTTQRRSFVLTEIDYAQQENKTILPVMVQKTKLPIQIAGIQYIDLTDRPNDMTPIVEHVAKRFNIDVQREPKPIAQMPRELHALNPLDWLRLYVWLFFRPSTLKTYDEHFEKTSTKATGSWLSLTISLLPLFIPSLAASVGTLEWHSMSGWEWLTPPLALAVIVGLWLVSGLFYYFFTNNFFMFIVVGSVASVMNYVIGLTFTVFFVTIVLTDLVAGGVAFASAGIVSGVVVAGSLAGSLMAFLALGIVFTLTSDSIMSIFLCIFVFVMTGIAIGGVKNKLSYRVKEGKASVMSVLAGLAVPVSLAVLIGVSFFGQGA